jgi:hypothetical protein
LKHPRYSPISELFDADEYPECVVLLDISSVLVLMGTATIVGVDWNVSIFDGRSVEPLDPSRRP